MLTYDKYFSILCQLFLEYMKKWGLIFHFPFTYKNYANNIIKSKISSDSKSFALPNSTMSSFSSYLSHLYTFHSQMLQTFTTNGPCLPLKKTKNLICF